MALKDMPAQVKDAVQATQRRMLGVLSGEALLSERSPSGTATTKRPKHVYAGTANRNAVAKRRRKAKLVRQSRRVNRRVNR